MKIILKQSIDNLGNEGEILDVKPGYARNYLIPKGWAKQATKLNIISTQKEIEVKTWTAVHKQTIWTSPHLVCI